MQLCVLTQVFAGLILLWPLLDWVAQQLPSGQTQLGWLKPTFVIFQKHVLSMSIYTSHTRNEGKKEIVISIHWLNWHQRVDSSKNRNHRAREGEKNGISCHLVLPPGTAAGIAWSPPRLWKHWPCVSPFLKVRLSLMVRILNKICSLLSPAILIFFPSVYEPMVLVLLLGDGPHVHSLSSGRHLLAPCPFASLPIRLWPAFRGAGWPGAQRRRGVTIPPAAGPTAGTRTPMAHPTWWNPCALWGGSVRSAPQCSAMMIWGLKIWLYHYAAVSWVLMTLSINNTSCCPGLVDTNSFPSRDVVLGAIAALKTLERNSKWENPSQQQRKEFARK